MSRLEIEGKFRVTGHDTVRQALERAGATPNGRVRERNWIFDRPNGSLRRAGCGLRIREAHDVDSDKTRATVTFKGPVLSGPYKSREEIECRMDDAKCAVLLMQRLGFETLLYYEKRRESWKLNRSRVELDEAPKIGFFVEVEGPDAEAVCAAQEAIGLGAMPHLPSSYVRMLLEWCDRHGISDRRIVF